MCLDLLSEEDMQAFVRKQSDSSQESHSYKSGVLGVKLSKVTEVKGIIIQTCIYYSIINIGEATKYTMIFDGN